jgi:uncharacterized repeat protein (TIGR01451 family)
VSLRGWGRLCSGLALLCPAAALQAAGTPANTAIANSATADYVDPGGFARSVSSNAAVVTVGEVLDVAVTANDAGNVAVTSPDQNSALSFRVTNLGNGTEPYNLGFSNSLPGDQFDPLATRIFLDDGNNLFDAADVQATSVTLNADEARTVFLVSDIPAALGNGALGTVRLTATAATGSGPPGTTFAAAGAGGTDAVVGASGASALQQTSHAVSLVTTTLVKSQTVDDGAGGTAPVAGATITYALTFTVAGSGSITGARIVDPVPAGTTYVAGSMRLNAAGLSDAVDADAGRFTGTGVQVDLGTLVAPATRAVTFRATIN